jgi:hypothetical protein
MNDWLQILQANLERQERARQFNQSDTRDAQRLDIARDQERRLTNQGNEANRLHGLQIGQRDREIDLQQKQADFSNNAAVMDWFNRGLVDQVTPTNSTPVPGTPPTSEGLGYSDEVGGQKVDNGGLTPPPNTVKSNLINVKSGGTPTFNVGGMFLNPVPLAELRKRELDAVIDRTKRLDEVEQAKLAKRAEGLSDPHERALFKLVGPEKFAEIIANPQAYAVDLMRRFEGTASDKWKLAQYFFRNMLHDPNSGAGPALGFANLNAENQAFAALSKAKQFIAQNDPNYSKYDTPALNRQVEFVLSMLAQNGDVPHEAAGRAMKLLPDLRDSTGLNLGALLNPQNAPKPGSPTSLVTPPARLSPPPQVPTVQAGNPVPPPPNPNVTSTPPQARPGQNWQDISQNWNRIRGGQNVNATTIRINPDIPNYNPAADNISQRGKIMYDYVGGADPDNPANARMFDGMSNDAIQLYRMYRQRLRNN